MENWIIRPGAALTGETSVPGDKSISHRAVMFGGLLARGTSHIRGWLRAGDTSATLRAVQALGIRVEEISETELMVQGESPQAPDAPLDLVNAGTGIRLIAGIMVGQAFPSVLDGSEQLRRRPMKRIIAPLRMMGAQIDGTDDKAPLQITPARLQGIRYQMPMASAQVKSAVLLAALFAEGATTLIQPGPARDHTEVMLRAMGADMTLDGDQITVRPGAALNPFNLTVPGDFSSAAFPMVAACLVDGSDITLTHINLNPTRTGLMEVLRDMGAEITITETGHEAGEPVGDIRVRASALHGVEIGGDVVVRMIDEFPALMVAATQAQGRTIVREAEELRVKETDRIAVMAGELRKLGAEVTETPDGFLIDGAQKLVGAAVDSHDDHRIAMSMTVAGMVAEGETIIHDAGCAADSFPGFAETMRSLGAVID